MVPIFLANLLSVETYGRIELAQSLGLLLSLVLGMGLQASVPLVLLRDEMKARWDTLIWTLSRLAFVLFLVAVAVQFTQPITFSTVTLSALAGSALMLQGLWAIYLKSNERGTLAVFLEGGFWFVVLVSALVVYAFGGPSWIIALGCGMYALVLIGFTNLKFRRSHNHFGGPDIWLNISVGLPLMFVALQSTILASAGRIILGVASDVGLVGIYAILYRATALPLIGHQVIVIALFRKLFVWDIDTLRIRAPIVVLIVSLIVLFFWGLAPYFAWVFGDAFVHAFSSNQFEAHLILSQTILWSGVALNDLLASRLQISKSIVYVGGPALAVGIVLVIYASVLADDVLFVFCLSYSLLMLSYYIVQCGVMWWKGHAFTLLWLLAFGAFFTAFSVAFLLHNSGKM